MIPLTTKQQNLDGHAGREDLASCFIANLRSLCFLST